MEAAVVMETVEILQSDFFFLLYLNCSIQCCISEIIYVYLSILFMSDSIIISYDCGGSY